MKAAQFNACGGPEVLRIVETDAPHAGPGQVRIKVRASGINPSDWKRRSGMYRAFDEVSFPAGVGVDALRIRNSRVTCRAPSWRKQ